VHSWFYMQLASIYLFCKQSAQCLHNSFVMDRSLPHGCMALWQSSTYTAKLPYRYVHDSACISESCTKFKIRFLKYVLLKREPQVSGSLSKSLMVYVILGSVAYSEVNAGMPSQRTRRMAFLRISWNWSTKAHKNDHDHHMMRFTYFIICCI